MKKWLLQCMRNFLYLWGLSGFTSHKRTMECTTHCPSTEDVKHLLFWGLVCQKIPALWGPAVVLFPVYLSNAVFEKGLHLKQGIMTPRAYALPSSFLWVTLFCKWSEGNTLTLNQGLCTPAPWRTSVPDNTFSLSTDSIFNWNFLSLSRR